MKKFLLAISLVIFTVFLFGLTNQNKVSADTMSVSNVKSVKAAHILVDTKEEALALKKRIDNGENFRALAQKYSKCPSGKEGGMLGEFQKGQMVKEFEDAAFKLPVGTVSEPVQTQFGWHLIKVYSKS